MHSQMLKINMPPGAAQPPPPPVRWMVLVASIWIQAFSANPYSFYSPTIKQVLGINQFQLNLLAVAKDFGEYAGILAGILCNKLPPWGLLSIGALLAFVGYGSIWLVASERVLFFPYFMMLIAICIGPNSATWFNTAVLVTCMRNFSHSRGLIAGFLKGFVGLSSAICTLIFTSFLSKDPFRLLLFLAVGPALVALTSMNFVRPIKPDDTRDEDEEQSNFFFVNILCICLALYLLIATLVEAYVSFDTKTIPSVIAGFMLLCLAVPAVLPLRDSIEWFGTRQRYTIPHESLKQPLLQSRRSRRRHHRKLAEARSRLPDIDEGDEEAFFLALAEGAVRSKKAPRRGEDFKLKQALVKADFWLLFLSFFCGVGPGFVTNDNLAQLGEAHGTTDVTTYVALLSIFNFLGRLGGGFISEHYVRSYAIPRPIWMAVTQAVMIIANILFAFGNLNFLGPASAIMGLCFGVQVAVMVPTASELFGLKHFGVIYNFINMSIPLGALCFSALLAGSLYDREAARGNSSRNCESLGGVCGTKTMLGEEGNVCYGERCFKLTFLILVGVCVVGIVLSLILSYRIRPVYKALYPPRARATDAAPAEANTSISSLPPAGGLDENQALP